MPTDPTPWDDAEDAPLPPWMHADDDGWPDTDEWDDADEGDGHRRLGRGWLLAVAAAVPWIVVVVLLLRSGFLPAASDGDPAPDPATASGTSDASGAAVPADETGSAPSAAGAPTATDTDGPAAAAPSPTDTDGPAAGAPSTTDADEIPTATSSGASTGASTGTSPATSTSAPRPRTTVTGADAVAMATAVGRAWLTGVGPTLAVESMPPPADLYAEHLVAEAIDHPSPGFAVVTLLAVVLEVDDGDYRDAAVRRLAVPVALDASGARPAGTPWWLPPPDLSPAEPSTTEVDDPDLALEAATAVTAAGYADVDLLGLATTASWPLVATFRGTAPGETESREHRVWLRPHLDGLVVAGWLPERRTATATAATDDSTTSPTTEDHP